MNAKEIRKIILEISCRTKCAHIGSNLSCADILSAVFSIMDTPPKDTQDFVKRDIFILSKAHSALCLYATLYLKGLMQRQILESYYKNNGTLPAHTDRFSAPYVEISAGSLGHGLPQALGFALGILGENNTKGRQRRVFCLLGDGELQEGSVWEAAMLAPKLKLSNLIVLIDYNNLQGYDRGEDIVAIQPLREKWLSFGFECKEVDGHSKEEIIKTISNKSQKPLCIIAKTTKGKGVSFMEDALKWHYYALEENELEAALKEIL